MNMKLSCNAAIKLLRFKVALTLMLLAVNTNAASPAVDVDTSATLDAAEVHRLGERMYREGVLPNGKPLRGFVRGDVEIDSTMFSCSNCHARSGLGTVEGQISSPAVNGASLYKPLYNFKDQLKNVLSEKKGVQRTAHAVRPAYTDETLARAISGGVDPSGRVFAPVMPRYFLEQDDMRILVGYLRTLSVELSPGVTDSTMKLATIVSDDVPPADREAMLILLENLVKLNKQSVNLKKTPQYAKMAKMLDEAFFRNITIARWELKGPPATWRAQLEEYNRKDPVFAIMGGITGGEWQPIHEFCEERQIPCLFPVTDFPVISETSWYTWYFSKGYYQEGETAARFIAGSDKLPHGKKVLQIASATREGKALASGFMNAWHETGKPAIETVTLDHGQLLTKDALKGLIDKYNPAALVVWAGPEVTSSLDVMAGNSEPPEMIIVSSRYLGKSLGSIPEHLRGMTFITYPYRLPEDEKKYEGYVKTLMMAGKLEHNDEKRISSRTFSLVHLFLEGLRELKLNFYRDNLLDVLAMIPDQYLPDFERLSFGPGQRYASKGCYIVQLEKGADARLIRKSDWVVY